MSSLAPGVRIGLVRCSSAFWSFVSLVSELPQLFPLRNPCG
jgi:hypothetical protein